MEPKILILDIETSPLELLGWKLWDENFGLEQIKNEWSILSFAAKFLGSKKIFYEYTGGRGVNKVRDDKKLLGELWKLLDAADIVVMQNGRKFDIKKINARLVMSGFKPYSPVKIVDTYATARKTFGFTSNRLAWMSKFLTSTPKSDHKEYPGFELWAEVLKDNASAWRVMKKYNIQDIIATEEVYLKLLPWITPHPNMGAFTKQGHGEVCPKCGSSHLQSRGKEVTQQSVYQRYQCQNCGGWSRGKQVLNKERRKELLV